MGLFAGGNKTTSNKTTNNDYNDYNIDNSTDASTGSNSVGMVNGDLSGLNLAGANGGFGGINVETTDHGAIAGAVGIADSSLGVANNAIDSIEAFGSEALASNTLVTKAALAESSDNMRLNLQFAQQAFDQSAGIVKTASRGQAENIAIESIKGQQMLAVAAAAAFAIYMVTK